MSTLYVLLGSFGLLSLVQWLWPLPWLTTAVRGRMALALLFLFTGISHFFFVDAMVQMIPPFVPARELLVYLTGILEIAGAIGLLLPKLQRSAGYALLLFLVGVLPANIYAALNYTGMGSHADGPQYLWVRVPLQGLFLAWTWYFALSASASSSSGSHRSAELDFAQVRDSSTETI